MKSIGQGLFCGLEQEQHNYRNLNYVQICALRCLFVMYMAWLNDFAYFRWVRFSGLWSQKFQTFFLPIKVCGQERWSEPWLTLTI